MNSQVDLFTFNVKQISPIISIAFYMVIIRVGIAQNDNNSRFEVHTTPQRIGNHATSLVCDSPYPTNRVLHIVKMTETNSALSYSSDGLKPELNSEIP